MKRASVLLALLASLALASVAAGRELGVVAAGRRLASAADHRFTVGDNVALWASKVGPFTNPRYGRHARAPPLRSSGQRRGSNSPR
jgi:hypothetical protein